jgi:hypothetical protein
MGKNSKLSVIIWMKNKYSEPQITRHIQLYGSPGHWKDKTVTVWNQIPKWVVGYNQRLSPISFSERVQ